MSTFFQKYKTHYVDTIKLGVPIVLGQLSIIAVGLADNIMVGQYSTNDLASASFVNSIFNIPLLFGMGFSYGLTPLVGQFFGRNDKDHIGGLLRNSLVANLLIGVLLFLIMSIFYINVHKLGQPEELLPLIRPYFMLQLISLIFIMLFYSFRQFADGITDTKTPMWIMLFCNALNVVGNYVLIYGKLGLPSLGLMGAGISTLLSRILALLIFAFIFFKSKRYKAYHKGYKETGVNGKYLKVLGRMGSMIGLQMGMETSLFSLTGIMVGWLGTIALAAHQIVVSISTLGFMIYYGVGASISVRISNFYGRGDKANIRKASMAGLHLVMVLALLISVSFYFARNYIGFIFSPSAEVVNVVSLLMIILIIYQFSDALQIVYANSLRAIGDVTSMAFISFVGYFLIALPVSYICGFVMDWGIYGIWAGYPVGLSIGGILMLTRYYYTLKRTSFP